MIKVSNIYKQFKLYDKPSDRLKEIIFQRFLDRKFHHIYEALKGISFEVKEGETLGILGKNGAGKSTLLKIITGVLLPNSGSYKIDGKITGLLELGTGFDNELSGMQNITGNGLLIGMTKTEILQQRQAIIDFSELGDFIEEPIRTYSSGMVMRLAFSIAMHAHPKCFVIDEALSVGDAHFQQKCMRHIRQFRQKGGSIIFVSHDLNAVKMICDKALVLDQGRVVAQGTPEEAVNHYNRLMSDLDEQEKLLPRQTVAQQNYGNQKAKIIKAKLWGEQSNTSIVSCGEKTFLSIDFLAQENISDMSVGIMIRDRFGQDIFGTNTNLMGKKLDIEKVHSYQSVFTLPMEIAPGKYSITIALHSKDTHIENCYHWIDNMISFEVAGIIGHQFAGICRLNATVEQLRGDR